MQKTTPQKSKPVSLFVLNCLFSSLSAPGVLKKRRRRRRRRKKKEEGGGGGGGKPFIILQ
jgi:hypothetical protein